MAINVYVDTPSVQVVNTTTGDPITISAVEAPQATAYIMSESPIEAHEDSQSQATAIVNPATVIPGLSSWASIIDKPFDTVDDKTLSTEGGVLRFKTASYKDLTDKPSIEGVPLVDDKSFEELGMEECSILDIEKMFT